MTEAGLKTRRSVHLRLSVACHLDKVRPAARATDDFLKSLGVSPADRVGCELALVEACNNAVSYATAPGRGKPIEIEVTCAGDEVQIRVSDHTDGFEWPENAVLPGPDEESGRGLFLIQSLMPESSYLRGPAGNCLVMKRPVLCGSCGSEAVAPGEWKLAESEQIIGDMADELSFCYESLSAIFRCSAALGRTNDIEEFTQRLFTDLMQITSADWFVLRLNLKCETELAVFAGSEGCLGLAPLSLREEKASPSELQAALRREDIWFGPRAPLEESDPLRVIKSDSMGLIHPFALGERLVGTIAVGKVSSGAQFTAVHANVVHTFADFLSMQILNARFQEEQVSSRIVSHELEIARNIQRSLLPKTLPRVPGYGVAGFCESARRVGGDFYDVMKLGEHRLLLSIADVMGKGLPAAMFAAILRGVLRAAPEWTDQPEKLLERANRMLFEELSGVDMFITAQLIFVDVAEERLAVASAGHCPLLLGTGGEAPIRTIAPEGLPLGILPDATYAAHTERLPRHSRVLLYTDGLTEARNSRGEFFGQERLINWFRKTLRTSRSADQLKEELAMELTEFQSQTPPADDQTFLIMA